MLSLFALHHHRLPHVFPLQVFYQDCLVFSLLILFAHQVELLELLPAHVQFCCHSLVLHKLSLPRGGTLVLTFVDILQLVLQLLALHLLGLLLSVLNRGDLLSFLVVKVGAVEHVLLLPLFVLLFPLVALHGVLLEELEVVLLLLLVAPLQLLVHLAREGLRRLLHLALTGPFRLGCALHLHLERVHL